MPQFTMLFGLVSTFTCFYLFYTLVRQRPVRQDRIFLALSLFVLGFWVFVNFIHLLIPSPSDALTTFQYRAVFSLESLAVAFLLLFGLAYFKGRALKRRVVAGILAISLILAGLNATGLVIKRGCIAGYTLLGTKYIQEEGPLYPLSVSIMGGGALVFVVLIFLKWRRSRGLERHRSAYILWGFGTYIPVFLFLAGVINAITSHDYFSDYLFALSVIPYWMTAYSLTRFRLLDLRLAARLVISRLSAVILLSLPPFLVLVFLGSWLAERPNTTAVIFIGYLGFSIPLAPPIHRLLERAVSRAVFPGLFDVEAMASMASQAVSTEGDLRKGLESALLTVAETLRLDSLVLRLHPEEETVLELGWLKTYGGWEKVERWRRSQRTSFERPDPSDSIVIPDGEHEEPYKLFHSPLCGLKGECGLLLAEKRAGLEPLDLDLLTLLSKDLGLAVENQLQHLRLLAQLDRLKRAQEALAQSSRMSGEIVMVASHELKTPLTILYGISTLAMTGKAADQSALEAIRREAEKLRSLTEEFTRTALWKEGPLQIS